MKHKVIILGNLYTYNCQDQSLTVNGVKTFDRQTMTSIASEYKGCNRIHKPMALLFWTDMKNGKQSNWQTTKH